MDTTLRSNDAAQLARKVLGLFKLRIGFVIMITALAGLSEHVVEPDEALNCYGIFWISTWPYRCWKEIGHGSVAMERAITESCDIYFYQLGLRLKVEALARWTRDFGFGEPSGIDLSPRVNPFTSSRQPPQGFTRLPLHRGLPARFANGVDGHGNILFFVVGLMMIMSPIRYATNSSVVRQFRSSFRHFFRIRFRRLFGKRN